MPFLTVDVVIGNQAFSHSSCNILPGLSYNKENILIKRTTLKPKLNLRQKLWKVPGSPVIDVSVEKNSLLVYVLKIFRNFGESVWLCSGNEGRDKETKGPSSTLCGDFLSFY